MKHSTHHIAETIVQMLDTRAATSSICPSEVARKLEDEEDAWRALMPAIREVAATMHDEGRLRITRGDQQVARHALHDGPIRLRRPEGTPS